MKKLLLYALCLMPLVTACNEKPLAVVEFKCGDTDVLAKVYQNRLDASIGTRKITMPQVISADGAKYSVDGMILWNKGKNWFMLTDEDTANEKMLDCVGK